MDGSIRLSKKKRRNEFNSSLIKIANEIEGYNCHSAFTQVESIYDISLTIYQLSEHENFHNYMAANQVAEKRITDILILKNFYLPKKNFMGKRDNS